MKLISDIGQMRSYVRKIKHEAKTIGFVPTMGYLHEGHLSLMREASKNEDVVIISIFVNPTQFRPGEDYGQYPRDMERDKTLAEHAGVDVIFAPGAEQMYPKGYRSYVDVEEITEPLCGRFRPGHFRGVTSVCCKLFNIVQPDAAYFGQKDLQQAVLIKRMVEDLNMNLEVKVLPIVREPDGLAMSSRNTYLNPKERKDALCLYQSLTEAKQMIEGGQRNPRKIIQRMRDIIEPKASNVDYISAVDMEELKDAGKLNGEVLIAIAAWVGETRLIDNMIVKMRGGRCYFKY